MLDIDDGLIASTGSRDLDEFLAELKSILKITRKKVAYYLVLEINRRDGSIKTSQSGGFLNVLTTVDAGQFQLLC